MAHRDSASIILECVNILLHTKFTTLTELYKNEAHSSLIKILKESDICSNHLELADFLYEYFGVIDLVDLKNNGSEIEVAKTCFLLIYIAFMNVEDLRSKLINGLFNTEVELKLKCSLECFQKINKKITRQFIEDFIMDPESCWKNNSTSMPKTPGRFRAQMMKFSSPVIYSNSPGQTSTDSPLRDLVQSPSFCVQKVLDEKRKELTELRNQKYFVEEEKREKVIECELLANKNSKLVNQLEQLRKNYDNLRSDYNTVESQLITGEDQGQKQILNLQKQLKHLRKENLDCQTLYNKMYDESSELTSKLNNVHNKLKLVEAERNHLCDEAALQEQATEQYLLNIIEIKDSQLAEMKMQLGEMKKDLSQLKEVLSENTRGMNNSEMSFEGSCFRMDVSNMSDVGANITGENMASAVIDLKLAEVEIELSSLQKDHKLIILERDELKQQISNAVSSHKEKEMRWKEEDESWRIKYEEMNQQFESVTSSRDETIHELNKMNVISENLTAEKQKLSQNLSERSELLEESVRNNALKDDMMKILNEKISSLEGIHQDYVENSRKDLVTKEYMFEAKLAEVVSSSQFKENELKSSLENEISKVSLMDESLNIALESIMKLETEKKNLSVEVDTMAGKEARWNQAEMELNEKIIERTSSLEEKEAQWKNDEMMWMSKYEELNDQSKMMASSMEQSREDHVQLKSIVEKIVIDKNKLSQTLSEKSMALDESIKCHAVKDDELKNLKEKTASLKDQHNQYVTISQNEMREKEDAFNANLKDVYSAAQSREKELKDCLESDRTKCARAEEKLETAQNDRNKLEGELEKLELDLRESIEKTNTLKDQMMTCEQSIEARDKKILQQEACFKTKEDELHATNLRILSLEEKVHEYDQQKIVMENLTAENNKLFQRVEEQSLFAEESGRSNLEMKEKIKSTEEQIASLEEIHKKDIDMAKEEILTKEELFKEKLNDMVCSAQVKEKEFSSQLEGERLKCADIGQRLICSMEHNTELETKLLKSEMCLNEKQIAWEQREIELSLKIKTCEEYLKENEARYLRDKANLEEKNEKLCEAELRISSLEENVREYDQLKIIMENLSAEKEELLLKVEDQTKLAEDSMRSNVEMIEKMRSSEEKAASLEDMHQEHIDKTREEILTKEEMFNEKLNDLVSSAQAKDVEFASQLEIEKTKYVEIEQVLKSSQKQNTELQTKMEKFEVDLSASIGKETVWKKKEMEFNLKVKTCEEVLKEKEDRSLQDAAILADKDEKLSEAKLKLEENVKENNQLKIVMEYLSAEKEKILQEFKEQSLVAEESKRNQLEMVEKIRCHEEKIASLESMHEKSIDRTNKENLTKEEMFNEKLNDLVCSSQAKEREFTSQLENERSKCAEIEQMLESSQNQNSELQIKMEKFEIDLSASNDKENLWKKREMELNLKIKTCEEHLKEKEDRYLQDKASLADRDEKLYDAKLKIQSFEENVREYDQLKVVMEKLSAEKEKILQEVKEQSLLAGESERNRLELKEKIRCSEEKIASLEDMHQNHIDKTNEEILAKEEIFNEKLNGMICSIQVNEREFTSQLENERLKCTDIELKLKSSLDQNVEFETKMQKSEMEWSEKETSWRQREMEYDLKIKTCEDYLKEKEDLSVQEKANLADRDKNLCEAKLKISSLEEIVQEYDQMKIVLESLYAEKEKILKIVNEQSLSAEESVKVNLEMVEKMKSSEEKISSLEDVHQKHIDRSKEEMLAKEEMFNEQINSLVCSAQMKEKEFIIVLESEKVKCSEVEVKLKNTFDQNAELETKIEKTKLEFHDEETAWKQMEMELKLSQKVNIEKQEETNRQLLDIKGEVKDLMIEKENLLKTVCEQSSSLEESSRSHNLKDDKIKIFEEKIASLEEMYKKQTEITQSEISSKEEIFNGKLDNIIYSAQLKEKELNSNLEQERAKNADMEENLDKERIKNSEFESEMRNMEMYLNLLLEKETLWKKTKSQLNDKIKSIEECLKEREERLSREEARWVDKDKELNKAKEEVMRIEREKDKTISSLKEEVQATLEKGQEDRKSIKEQMKNVLKGKIEDMMVKIDGQDKEYNTLSTKYESAKRSLSEVCTSLKNAAAEKEAMTAQMLKLKEMNSHLNTNLSNERTIQQELNSRITKLESERQPLKNKLQSTEILCKRLTNEKRSLEAQLNMADSSIRDMKRISDRQSMGFTSDSNISNTNKRANISRRQSHLPSTSSSNGDDSYNSTTQLIPQKTIKEKTNVAKKLEVSRQTDGFARPTTRSSNIQEARITRVQASRQKSASTSNIQAAAPSQPSVRASKSFRKPTSSGALPPPKAADMPDTKIDIQEPNNSSGSVITRSQRNGDQFDDWNVNGNAGGQSCITPGLKRTVPKNMAALFNCDDEEMEFNNHKYLQDLKFGNCNVPNDEEWRRVSELQRRNSLYPAHMRSAYMAEMQFQPTIEINEEDIRSGHMLESERILNLTEATNNLDISSPPAYNLRKRSLTGSITSEGSENSSSMNRKPSKRLSTSYSRPGPPTPGKRSLGRDKENRRESDISSINSSFYSVNSTTSNSRSLRSTPKASYKSPLKLSTKVRGTPKPVNSPTISSLRNSKGQSPAHRKGRTPSSILKLMGKGKSPWRKLESNRRDFKGFIGGNSSTGSTGGNSKLRIFRNPFGAKNYNVRSASMRLQDQVGLSDSLNESGRVFSHSISGGTPKR